MSTFMPGDRVRYSGTYTRDLAGAVGTVREQANAGNVYVTWDKGERPSGVLPENIERLVSLDFVGPAPKPVEGPVIQTPFRVDRAAILDARGEHVGGISGAVTTAGQDREFAALVVKLLNAHFGAE
ncbi:hypothetical protein [Amycolatopsis sp. NPDC003731]